MRNVDPDALNSERNCIRYWQSLKLMSQRNRTKPTEAEEKMWKEVLSRDQTGYRFLRQKPIHRFVADFYCSKLNLAIEIDGDSHLNKIGTDLLRDKFLKQIGITTIRFSNEEVLNNISAVKEKIIAVIPLLSKRG